MTIDPVNRWLKIPEADYIGHMSSPAVGQRQVLNRLFADGKGLEHFQP